MTETNPTVTEAELHAYADGICRMPSAYASGHG